MYELSTLLTVIVRTVAGWFGVRTAADELPLLFDGRGKSASNFDVSTASTFSTPADCAFFSNGVDAAVNGKLFRLGGDDGAPGYYM